jgi:hypothetical protein
MELLDWDQVLVTVLVGALVVFGGWALVLLGLAVVRGRSPLGSRAHSPTPEPPKHHRQGRVPPASVCETGEDQPAPGQSF